MNQENLQQGVHLYFYCHLRAKHDGMLLSECCWNRPSSMA